MISLALALAATLPPTGVDVLFPTSADPARLRIEVRVEGNLPDSNWGAFLDKLFDHFDRDGDGLLSAAEASRVLSLPLPGGREVKMDFNRLDTNKDGKATRAEFRAFYRQAGFTPAVVIIQSPTIEQQKLSDAVFRHLDRDGDGTLTRAELCKAGQLLRRLDENEDEILEPNELLAHEPAKDTLQIKSKLQVAIPSKSPDGVARFHLGKADTSFDFEAISKQFFAGTNSRVFSVPQGNVMIRPSSGDTGFRTAKEFYSAQFAEVLGKESGLKKADLESDAALQAIAGMFDAADRDGDSKLTAAELKAFLDLIEMGVGCQVVIAVEDRGSNLFDLLDTNCDGKLDLAELNRAAELPQIEKTKISRQYRFDVSRGPVGPVFGPVPVPIAVPKNPAKKSPFRKGPGWFQAIDRNGDGFVSAAEFTGPPEFFAKLDRDWDGRISVAEAELAGK